MIVRIFSSKEFLKLIKDEGMKVKDLENGVLSFETPSQNNNVGKIGKAVSKILTDNIGLTLINLNVVLYPDGHCEALATFVSFADIILYAKDPVKYRASFSTLCSPYM